jgi:hypothetical protein
MSRLGSLPTITRLAACVLAVWSGTAGAQQLLPPSGGGLQPPPATAPRSLGPAQTIAPLAATPVQPPPPLPSAGTIQLALSARYGRETASQITGGLLWRVFPARPDQTGTFRVLREDRNPSALLTLPPGDYVVHVSFGLASAVRAIHLKEPTRETFEIPAGGIKLEGRVGDIRIPPSQITFDIYKGSQFEPGNKAPLVQNVATGDVVVVPEGPYFIVSNYGDTNAVVRSDIRVQAGKLTDVTVNHRAALISLKLVSARGGEALANTTWLVITPGGDPVKELNSAFARVVLAEGDYRAIARNEGHSYERDFKVITGVDGEIEVIAR